MNTFYEQAYAFLVSREHMKKDFVRVDKTNDSSCTVIYKNSQKIVRVQEGIGQAADTWVVCKNSKENVDTLVKNWQTYVQMPNLAVIFLVNGCSWSIKPHLHAKIATPQALERGIYALYENACI
jgi:hypothetical protein